MNYRHAYHAGNFADVFKHIVLTLLLEKLCEKEKPFCVLDCHAGIGHYSLKSIEAQKTLEYEEGITKLMQQDIQEPLFQPYLDIVRSLNTHSKDGLPVTFYPGSPLIIQHFLREADRLLACELHPEDSRALGRLCRPYHNVKVFQEDAYQWLNAELPPIEKRGLVLFDPPYEEENELKKIVKNIRKFYPKFSHGVYVLWYPIKTYYAVQHFHRALVDAGAKKLLVAELCIHPCTDPDRLNGCGVAIINPPWQIEEKLKAVLPKLLDCFSSKGYGKWLVR